jgi:hypothetical protein
MIDFFDIKSAINFEKSIEKKKKNAKVLIFQFGDQRQVKEKQWWIESMISYAKYHEYSYIRYSLDEFKAHLWINSIITSCKSEISGFSSKLWDLKQFLLYFLLSDMHAKHLGYDHIVYADLNVYAADYKRPIQNLLEKSRQSLLYDETLHKTNSDCFLLTQEQKFSLDTGLIIFSPRDFSRINLFFNSWLHNWIQVIGHPKSNRISFTLAILEHAQIYFNIPEALHKTIDHCKDSINLLKCTQNLFKTSLKSRSFSDFCIASETSRELELRFNPSQYSPGDMYFHNSNKLVYLNRYSSHQIIK